MQESLCKAGPTADVSAQLRLRRWPTLAYRAGLRSHEDDVAPRSDQPTGDLAAAAHRVLTDYAGGVRLTCVRWPLLCEHVVAPCSDQPTGDLAATAHRVLTDYAAGVHLPCCALSGTAARQGCVDLGVCQRRGLSSASGAAKS